ncbi:hypothetical protein F610DRAFT_04757 [Streptomyces sp. LaPpAH-199]|nr:hypothetical protein F610DRAFT_04757 [Streptomyces sp. LaPpAH-199]
MSARSCSVRTYPAPMPSSRRPEVSASVPAVSRARSAGFQNPAFSTKVPTRGRSVASAAATREGKGAGMSRWSGTRITS